MKKITVSAPGKLMLLGEHSVVYGHPCLVTAVNQRIFTTVELTNQNDLLLNAPDVKIENYKKPIKDLGKGETPKGAKFIEIAVKNIFGCIRRSGKSKRSGDASGISNSDERFWSSQNDSNNLGLKISTRSEFSSQYGFGSSSAATVCVIKALSELVNLKLTNKQIFDISYKTVLDIQGKGSGFDIAAAIYGGTLYFFTAGKIIEPLNIFLLPLIVGYSAAKADTVTLIENVKEKFKDNQKRLDEIYDSIEVFVEKAKTALLKNDLKTFGSFMNENQILLNELGVSIPKLDNMVKAATEAGAYGAKLSGAGGGDCMIAVGSKEKTKKIEQEIEKVGGKIIQVNANAEGVRVEK